MITKEFSLLKAPTRSVGENFLLNNAAMNGFLTQARLLLGKIYGSVFGKWIAQIK
jgi:hypothetical protein